MAESRLHFIEAYSAGTLITREINAIDFASGFTVSRDSTGDILRVTAGGGTAAGGSVQVIAGASTSNVATLSFSNASGVSFGLSNMTITASVKTDYLTTAALSNHSHGNPTLALTNLSGTTASASNGLTISLAAGNYLTTARRSTDALGLATAGTNITWTANSDGLSINAGAYLTTAALSNHSHGNPTLALTNLTGTTASASNGLTISLSAAAGGGAAISGNTNSQNTGTVNFSNSNGVSFGLNTNGVMTGSVALNATASDLDPVFGSSLLTNSTLGQNSLYFYNFDIPQDLSAYRINFFASIATTLLASNSTNSAGWTLSAALYSRGVGTATDRIATFWSGSAYIRMNNSSNTQVRVTHPLGISNSTAVSTASNAVVSSSNASTYLVNSVGGYRVFPMPISSTLSPGRYWIAVAQSTQSSNAIGIIQASVLQQTNGNNIAYRPFGTSSAASNASFLLVEPGNGTYSATSAAFPATVALTTNAILAAPTLVMPYINFSAQTTGTSVL